MKQRPKARFEEIPGDENQQSETKHEPEDHSGFQPWLLVLVMAGGGLASGLLVYTFAPEAEGHGTDAAIDAFHNKRGEIRGRIPIIKTIASAITLGTGGSAGREGPIAQIGAGFGSYLGGLLKLPARDRRIMLAAGMGAGVGAIFRAPLAGAVFAGEILYRDADIESDAIVPAAISSAVATLFSASGCHPRFDLCHCLVQTFDMQSIRRWSCCHTVRWQSFWHLLVCFIFKRSMAFIISLKSFLSRLM